MSNSCQQTQQPRRPLLGPPASLRTWLIDLPPWVTDVPSTGHHNGRVMREWWDLPTASSTRPFACEVRCQREAGCGLGGSAGGGGTKRFSIKQPRKTATSFQMAPKWKIKTIKAESIVSALGAFGHHDSGGKMERSDGNFVRRQTKGCYWLCCFSRRHVFLWRKYFSLQAQVSLSSRFPSSPTEEGGGRREGVRPRKQEVQSGLHQPLRAFQETLYSHISWSC